jgi:hypothetical protein
MDTVFAFSAAEEPIGWVVCWKITLDVWCGTVLGPRVAAVLLFASGTVEFVAGFLLEFLQCGGPVGFGQGADAVDFGGDVLFDGGVRGGAFLRGTHAASDRKACE